MHFGWKRTHFQQFGKKSKNEKIWLHFFLFGFAVAIACYILQKISKIDTSICLRKCTWFIVLSDTFWAIWEKSKNEKIWLHVCFCLVLLLPLLALICRKSQKMTHPFLLGNDHQFWQETDTFSAIWENRKMRKFDCIFFVWFCCCHCLG